jgi:glycosyltransferase involved in cell wall biosynthesis
VSPAPGTLRIALVGPTYPFRGGIAHYTTLLCRALRRRHAVRFLALSRQYPRLLFPGMTQHDRSASGLREEHEPCVDSINPWTWIAAGRRVARERFDLLLFSWWHPFFAPAFGTIARVARRRSATPVCFLCHNAIPHERTRIDRALLRYAYGPAGAFIVHSRQDRDDLQRLCPGATVLENPHPTYDVFSAERPTDDQARERLALAGKRVLLFFGFVRAYKGLDVLLDAVAGLDPRAGYHLLIVGEFYESRDKYAARLEHLAARGQLTLIDRYVPNEDLPLYFAAADLVMVPYLAATQSGVIQIAYAFGKPVVATTVGGIPEVVTPDRTGYLVPPGDAPALAATVRRHFESAAPGALAGHIAAEGAKYSWERMVETVEAAARAAAAPKAR